jgi:hypothetical protein
MFELNIDWDEHSGTCEDVHVLGFVGPSSMTTPADPGVVIEARP